MFDCEKTTQVAAYFLWLEGGTMKYLKLMKLMYLAERQYLLECGSLLTGDLLLCMKHGPVLSNTLSLFQGLESDPSWDAWISSEANYCLSLKRQPAGAKDFDCLNADALRICKELQAKFKGLNQWQLRNLTHTRELCPEWRAPTGSPEVITAREILRHHGVSEEDAERMIQALDEQASYEQLTRGLS